MAGATRRGRRKFLHDEWRGGNFLCTGSTTIFGEWRGISYGPLSGSSGVGELREPGKCRRVLGFLRTGFFDERSFARERHAQCGALPGAERACATTSRSAAGHSEWRDKRTNPLSAHDFTGIVFEPFR